LPTSFLYHMNYDKQILQVLSDVGERGLSVQHLAKHVYNMNCSLFAQPDWQEVYAYVQKYLLRNTKSSQALIEHTGRRGYYRLNPRSAAARQLMLEFKSEMSDEEHQDDAAPQAGKDLSLSLFDF